jgi:hypothetical protein
MTANYRQKYSVRIKRISGSDIVKKKEEKKRKEKKIEKIEFLLK